MVRCWLTLFRVVRCGPGGTWGPDPVPEVLDKSYPWYAPWRLWIFGRKTAADGGQGARHTSAIDSFVG